MNLSDILLTTQILVWAIFHTLLNVMYFTCYVFRAYPYLRMIISDFVTLILIYVRYIPRRVVMDEGEYVI